MPERLEQVAESEASSSQRERVRVNSMPSQSSSEGMSSKLCRQVSIESPGPLLKDCVFSFDVPVPDIPATGARIRVECAGACYRLRKTPSQSSITSVSSLTSRSSLTSLAGDVSTSCVGSQQFNAQVPTPIPLHYGVRDAALFPGYEVAGIVEAIGEEVSEDSDIKLGDKVIVYPFEGVPHGYAEYMTVPELKYLVKVPDGMPLSIAAMLPTGALWAMNTVQVAREHILKSLHDHHEGKIKILVVGTGGLALWALRLAQHYFKDLRKEILLVVACLRDEGILLAKEAATVNVVQWNEDCYEKILIERTKDVCEGEVDIVIDFGTTSRSLHRSLQCLSKGGIVLISSEVSERLLPKFSRRSEERQQILRPVDVGTLEQLRELVELVSSGQIEPPPYTVFPADQAKEVVRRLCNSEIQGRAILRFHSID